TQDNEKQLRELIEASFEAVFVHKEGIILEANKGIFGYTESEVVGKKIYEFITHEEHQKAEKISNSHEGSSSEIKGFRKNGDTFYAETISVVQMFQGYSVRIVGMRDITIRKEMELREQKSTQKRLIDQERMASLGRLVAGVVHEINTPVGVAVTAISYMERKVKKVLDLFHSGKIKRSELSSFLETSKQNSSIILRNLSRASTLIQSFKEVAVDQTSERKREFKIREYLEEVFLSIKPGIKNLKLSINIDCDEQLTLSSYPGVLSQVITNLLMNSITHAYDGKKEGSILFQVENIDGCIVLIYTDDGKGIPKENLSKIFDPFFTTRGNSGGSGLGLHIIYNLITQKLKGHIYCDSTVGVGTTFRIELPY
ncbi:MAG: PAS domain S-box-containing protein, partial [bacterium]